MIIKVTRNKLAHSPVLGEVVPKLFTALTCLLLFFFSNNILKGYGICLNNKPFNNLRWHYLTKLFSDPNPS